MRIALVTETFYPATDGTTTTLKAVADRLVDTGHQVMVVAPGPGIGSYRGCPVVRIRPLEPAGAQVRDALDGFRPDLVHVTSPGTLGRKALKHTRRNGIASVVVEQGAGARRGRRLLARQGGRPRRHGARHLVVDGRPDGRVRGERRALAPRGRHRRLHPRTARPVAARGLVADPRRGQPPGRRGVRRRAAQAPRRTPAGRGGLDPQPPAWSSSAVARSATGSTPTRRTPSWWVRCRPAT